MLDKLESQKEMQQKLYGAHSRGRSACFSLPQPANLQREGFWPQQGSLVLLLTAPKSEDKSSFGLDPSLPGRCCCLLSQLPVIILLFRFCSAPQRHGRSHVAVSMVLHTNSKPGLILSQDSLPPGLFAAAGWKLCTSFASGFKTSKFSWG